MLVCPPAKAVALALCTISGVMSTPITCTVGAAHVNSVDGTPALHMHMRVATVECDGESLPHLWQQQSREQLPESLSCGMTVSRVYATYLPVRADPSRCQKRIEASASTQVQHSFTQLHAREGQRVAAAEPDLVPLDLLRRSEERRRRSSGTRLIT